MTMIYNKNAKKKAANLSINSDLLQKAKANKINLSNSLEKALERLLIEKEISNWKDTNQEAMDSYNNRIERNGSFSDDLRSF